jgi:hypothetical protein
MRTAMVVVTAAVTPATIICVAAPPDFIDHPIWM